eukprot:m.160057 g.160057  ORF g.160057 m.160057 type:complete len:151 (-) comp14345_c0_seq10:2732-3184(-)
MSGFSLEGSSVGAAPNSLSRPSRVPPMPAGQRSQGQRAYLSGSMLEMLAQQVQDRSQGRAAQHGIAQGHHAGVREQGHLAGGIVGAGWGDGSISGSKVQGSTSGRTQRIARSADPSRVSQCRDVVVARTKQEGATVCYCIFGKAFVKCID